MIPTTQTVCVVIPIYTGELSASERASLARCFEILGKYPITIVKPQSLDITQLRSSEISLHEESFPDEYFMEVQGYNRLMLSDSFYARFASYEFILIYQLDAFVFSDQLLYWCALNYDYIGAPWLPDDVMPNLMTRIRNTLRRKLYRMIDKQHKKPAYGNTRPQQFHYSVGNGGFSLRRVRKMREVLHRLSPRAELYRTGARLTWGEDIFFSVEPNRFWHRLRIPNVVTAASFAWELNPKVAASLTGGTLPFGCHAWNKRHLDEWRPIFSRLHYSFDALVEPATSVNTRADDSDKITII